jgi:hypothetical protein
MATITSQLTAITAEIAITTLGAIALSKGMDGAIFAGCIAALAGLGGYQIKSTAINDKAINAAHPKPPPPPP